MSGRTAGRAIRSTVLCAAVLVLLASSATAVISSWGPQADLPRPYSWNYGNALDATGTAGTSAFRLTDVFVSDATTPQAAFATSSHDGVTWSAARRLSGTGVNAENPTVAAAAGTLIAGWMTGFSPYDPAGSPRRVQVSVSPDRGATWGAPKSLSPRGVAVDYPVVAAGRTSFGPINLYAVWVDAETGRVTFRERSGDTGWSDPISLGVTTRSTSAGFSGFANVSAVGDLVVVAWIADAHGTVEARAIDLAASGSATAATDRTRWGARTAMSDRAALAQHGYPIVSSSRAVPGVATIAWNTSAGPVFATATGETIDPGSAPIWHLGSVGGRTYTGGYATAVEPAPGGFVAMWAACRDTSLVHDCNVGKPEARVDLLAATSTDGVTFTKPSRVAGSGTPGERINDAPSIVATADHVYVQYDGSTSDRSAYDVFARVASGGP
jgi:hypothetical protein